MRGQRPFDGNAHAVVGRLEATTMVEFERRLFVFLGFGA